MAARSFDRTFILAPTQPGTPAAIAGWPCVILSDMMVVRNWTNPELMTPSSNAEVATNGAAGQPAGPALVSFSEHAESVSTFIDQETHSDGTTTSPHGTATSSLWPQCAILLPVPHRDRMGLACCHTSFPGRTSQLTARRFCSTVNDMKVIRQMTHFNMQSVVVELRRGELPP